MALTPIICFSFLFLILNSITSTAASLGQWNLLQQSIGISAMHMQLLNNDRVIIFDRTDFGSSNLSLPDGRCRNNTNDFALQHDCSAHSAEYDVLTNSVRPLMVQTDTWCSSGAVCPDGYLIQTGGFNDGDRAVRVFQPCSTCDWQEIPNGLVQRRWYPTNQILPDGRVIIIGGQQNYYEFYPKSTSTNTVFNFTFLEQTSNLYPFVHLNVDGNLFIFAYNKGILFNYTSNTVVQTFPPFPGYQPRTYPYTGSSVLLPLKNLQQSLVEAEVLICGGATWGSDQVAISGTFKDALDTCGRIRITDPNPTWNMETMPFARVMADMTLLPNGQVLIINGAAKGVASWEYGRDPVFYPVLYQPDYQKVQNGSSFQTLNPSPIPRMYHSTAILLRDGRVLVGGSNSHQYYNFTGVLFPTELSLEAFSPAYLDSEFLGLRPTINTPASYAKLTYGQQLELQFSVTSPVNESMIEVTMVAPSFTTHSFSMNQRLLVLDGSNVTALTNSSYAMEVTTPNSAFLAPPGYYLLFLVHQDIPSEGIWVQIK
ncbi:aldehyde oxidase GLOX-like [Macadamia integrifolia]|uniref:aldehyde oxidase GLOX-like n=1 Tax=Macadamia integrifolia TaxID=60698 RepID=UPI001C4E6AA9|nr:aldehyde oxidase GLOX-like [Macadamia integrifolia]